ncbi:MAG: hypothetical protein GY835_06905 [bacterium]|nr:hypothetical protein [bacterium]
MTLNNTNIKYLESLVTGIKEVTGCRIMADDSGVISEIHVTASSDRQPRLIARDVDTLLKVKAGLDIDHRVIGVVIEDPVDDVDEIAEPENLQEDVFAEVDSASLGPEVDDSPTDFQDDGLIIENFSDDEPRILFKRISVTHEAGRVHAEVTLCVGERCEVGEGFSADTPDGNLAAVIQATLQGVLLLHQPEIDFSDPAFRTITFGNAEVLVIYLTAVESRNVQTYVGSAIVRQDIRQAAVLATLSALNRLTGIWPDRESPEFDIV